MPLFSNADVNSTTENKSRVVEEKVEKWVLRENQYYECRVLWLAPCGRVMFLKSNSCIPFIIIQDYYSHPNPNPNPFKAKVLLRYPYNDACLYFYRTFSGVPIFEQPPSKYYAFRIMEILLDPNIDEDKIAKQRPLQTQCSSTFVVDITQLTHPDDI